MKLSSKHTDNSPLSELEQEVERLQTGGRLPLLDITQFKTSLPSKQDNVKVKPVIKAKAGPTDYSRDQGTISAYDKSSREKLLSSMYKFSNTGNGALTGLIAAPVISGAKLLRPDKYFEGVDSDSKLGDAVGNFGMDVLNVLPAGKPLKMAIGEVKGVAAATGEAFGESVHSMKSTWNATKDLPLIKRMDNALLSGGAVKSRVGDQVGHSYFDMTADQVGRAVAAEKANAPAGALLGDYSMSANSSPIYWNQAARSGKDYKILRTGTFQDVNSGGFKGKRVEAAFPEETKYLHKIFNEEAQASKLKIDQMKNSGEISSNQAIYQMNQVDPNRRLFQAIMSSNENFDHAKKWFTNYKPTMDAGIEAVNAKTGLNFPMTRIRGYKGATNGTGNPNGLAYVQPTSLVVKGGHKRTLLTAESNLADIPRHYKLNKLRAEYGRDGNIEALASRIKENDVSSHYFNERYNNLKKTLQKKDGKLNMSLDDLYEEAESMRVPPPPTEINNVY